MGMADYAQALKVVDVWAEGNETGWVTPRVLYDPSVRGPRSLRYPLGQVMAPRLAGYRFFMRHGTVGANTLAYWGNGGSVASGAYTLAQYLVPHEFTEYRDGAVRDTTFTVFKMVPDWAACNHTGVCIGPIDNTNTLGVEYESLQNGQHDISEMQYIKGALLFAHAAVKYAIKDEFYVAHGLVATPWGRRSDPWAGRFDIAYQWELIQQIRHDAGVWQHWGLPQPARGF